MRCLPTGGAYGGFELNVKAFVVTSVIRLHRGASPIFTKTANP